MPNTSNQNSDTSSPTNTPFSLVVADIHLQPDEHHPINQTFAKFLTIEAKQAEKLFILGDLFEMWVGDDIGLQMYQPIIKLLRELQQAGTEIYLQFGNRDFLMRTRFMKATGIQLLADEALLELYDQQYLMLHGDTLCTDDHAYQRMRKVFRNKLIQWLFLSFSQKRRMAIGHKMRNSSKQHSQSKSEQIMDVNQKAVLDLFAKYPNVQHMIHGHTHRPAHHVMQQNHTTLHRWVLGDWRPQAKIIKLSKAGVELVDYL